MDLFRKYRSPRDELEYQTARSERENELIQNYNNQGITKDYPLARNKLLG